MSSAKNQPKHELGLQRSITAIYICVTCNVLVVIMSLCTLKESSICLAAMRLPGSNFQPFHVLHGSGTEVAKRLASCHEAASLEFPALPCAARQRNGGGTASGCGLLYRSGSETLGTKHAEHHFVLRCTGTFLACLRHDALPQSSYITTPT
eukprot:365578-Chlamydomonas_euryale.AAC.20